MRSPLFGVLFYNNGFYTVFFVFAMKKQWQKKNLDL